MYSCSLKKTVVIFDNQKTCGLRSPDTLESPTISRKIQALSGSLVVAQSSRSSDRCLLQWRPPCGSLDRFLGRLYSMYSFSGRVILLLFGRCGHRQISTVTRFQAHPSGFLHWARGPYSRAAGGSFLTGAVLKARSARGVSGSFCRSVLKPQLLAGCCPSVPSLAPSLTPSDSIIPNFSKHDRLHTTPSLAPEIFDYLNFFFH